MRASQAALVVKNRPANAGEVRDAGSVPGSGRAPGGGHSHPLSVLAWSVAWTEEPGGPQSVGRRDSTRLSAPAQRAVRAGCGRAPWVSQPSATHGRLPAPASPGEDSASPEMIPGRFLLLESSPSADHSGPEGGDPADHWRVSSTGGRAGWGGRPALPPPWWRPGHRVAPRGVV